MPYSTMARFKFGDGRVGEVKHATDIMLAIAGRKGVFTALALGADSPVLFRKGASEALGG